MRATWDHHSQMTQIEYDVSDVPGDVALALSQQGLADALARSLARDMRLGHVDAELFRQELVGVIAKQVDPYLDLATAP